MKNAISKLSVAAIIFAAFWIGIAQAQDVQLRDDHPSEYVVVRGDTLWDISGRFLENPWDWPAIWQANPQIENPHLIYPGDVVSLIYVDGQPRLVVNGENRLSPQIRESKLQPIDTIPMDAIDEFLQFPRVISGSEFDNLPYVVANNENRLNAVEGDRAYIRGFDGFVGQEVVIARLGHVYERASKRDGSVKEKRTKRSRWGERFPHQHETMDTVWRRAFTSDKRPVEVAGYELWEISRARVLKTGDPAIIEIQGGRREVNPGDYILPIDNYVYDSHFLPRAMSNPPENLEVVAVAEAVYGVGHYGIVSINGGSNDGIETGNTFAAFRPGQTIDDTVKFKKGTMKRSRDENNGEVTLPDEYVGQVMVFRTFDAVSYGIVLEGKNAVREFDLLKHADERL